MAKRNSSKISDLKYLGCGVDCRKNEAEWQEDLISYTGPIIRDPRVGKNVRVTPHDEVAKIDSSRKWHFGGSIGAGGSPHICAELSIKLGMEMKDDQHSYVEYTVTEIATLQDDISKDPDFCRVKHDGCEICHSNFENVLSTYILEYVDSKQKNSGADQDGAKRLGKQVRELKGRTAIAKLRDFTQGMTSESGGRLVADACADFINEKYKYTHYVYSIKRGRRKTITKRESERQIGVEVGGKGKIARCVEVASAGVQVNYSDGKDDREERDLGAETLEIIEMKLRPLHTLIHEKSAELKLIMETLLRSFDDISQGELMLTYCASTACKYYTSKGL